MLHYNQCREQAHREVETIFRTLLPERGLAVREEQIRLCHEMLATLLEGKIVLCDAGVGIGKTYAYLVAGILVKKHASGRHSRSSGSVTVSTSGIALQRAVMEEYLTFLSGVLLEKGIIQSSLKGIVRKGKEHFVCDRRLALRLEAVKNKKKNEKQREALASLRLHYDMDKVQNLSGFDRRLVSVPGFCPNNCPAGHFCRYRKYLKRALDTSMHRNMIWHPACRKGRTMDKDRIYYRELKCYAEATEKQRKTNYTSPYYDMLGIESEGLKKELRAFVLHHGGKVSFSTILCEKIKFRRLVDFLKEKDTSGMESFLDREAEKWMRQFRGWMLQNGHPLTGKKVTVYGNEHIVDSRQIKYFEKILRFLQPADERDEREKDIWELDRLDIVVRDNPIYNVKTLNFTKISQPDMREETKKAVYLRLQYEALGTVQNGMNAMRQFSAYLKEKYPKVQSCAEIDRNILEAYLIYRMTECAPRKGASNQVLALRSMLETIGKLYQYPQLDRLFLNTDIPPEEQPEFRVYSEREMKLLNAHIARMDEQIARCLVIHQMLGTRISDTLTLRRDCLYNEHRQKMIRIHQVKTDTYDKPISRELAMLIQKAAEYTAGRHGETKYIFVNEDDVSRPLQYTTVKHKVLAIIQREQLRDDDGKPFRFNSHMFRHYYGVKLTEMHLDDWTIAKLLGHKRLGSVQHYRKMSNQLVADETRAVRDMMTKIIYENLDGWSEEYEQIRHDGYREPTAE